MHSEVGSWGFGSHLVCLLVLSVSVFILYQPRPPPCVYVYVCVYTCAHACAVFSYFGVSLSFSIYLCFSVSVWIFSLWRLAALCDLFKAPQATGETMNSCYQQHPWLNSLAIVTVTPGIRVRGLQTIPTNPPAILGSPNGSGTHCPFSKAQMLIHRQS